MPSYTDSPYQVRGPDPDGDWFVVLVDRDDEMAIDEVFSSEGDALAMVERLNIPAPIERAARALFTYEPGPYGDCVEWAIEQPFGWIDCVDQVSLVLEAIREPSDDMVKAGAETGGFNGYYGDDPENRDAARDNWKAMIDALNAKSAGQA